MVLLTTSVLRAFGRRLVPLFLFGLIIASMVVASPAEARRYASMVVDHATGDVLFSRNPDRWVYPASLTKMMTLYMLFDEIEADRFSPLSKLTVSRRAAGMPASKLGLRAGSSITVRDAIRALIVKSANDVAVAVAEAIAGTESEFAELMTRRARQMGMNNTTFRNASGLPNSAQRTTARDMITLSRRLMSDFPGYYHLFSTKNFTYAGHTYRSHNRLMKRYAGMDGLKTGYIRASGFNLAASVRRDGHRLLAVVFGGRTGRSRDAHMEKILNQSFVALDNRPTFIASPIRRPEFDALIAQAASRPAEQSSTDRGSRDDDGTTVRVLLSSNGVPANIEGAVARLDAGAAPRPNGRVPNRFMPDNGPVITGLQEGQRKTSARGAFGVQVGAYYDSDLARRAAVQASRRVPSILLQGDISVSGLKGHRRHVYRARVVGLSRDAADLACATLRRQQHECLVVKAG